MTDAEIRRALRLVIQGVYVPEKKELLELYYAAWRLFPKIVVKDYVVPEKWEDLR